MKEKDKVLSDTNHELVEHLPDEWSSEEETDNTEEDIIKKYYLLHMNWLSVIDNNKVWVRTLPI